MKVKHIKQNAFKGDKNILIYVEDDKGNKTGIFDIYKNEYGYVTDAMDILFKTIKEAKVFVEENIEDLLYL